jgi:D-3-phosphoglycerate dehydrogenase
MPCFKTDGVLEMVKKKLLIVSEIAMRYWMDYDLSNFDVILADKKNYIKYVPEVDYIISGREEYPSSLLLKAKKKQFISRCGHGRDNISKLDGITVMTSKGALNTTLAEITICYILMGLRDVNQLDSDCRRGKWNPEIGNTLKGKIVGIIGYGNIGQEVAKLLTPFDCYILHYDIITNRSNCDLNQLLKESDIITLHCDKNETSINMINEETISKMKDGVILINTARGGIVNENDLIKSINKFKYVVLDVFEKEPLDIRSKLMTYSNILLGIHSANATEEGWKLMAKMAIENVIDYENSLSNTSKI